MKSAIHICRWCRCHHPSLEIDTELEPFETEGNFFYHKDCYQQMRSDREQKERIRNDLFYIRGQWGPNIDESVSYSHLMRCLNDLVCQGFSSDYLVFAFDYVVSHGMNLHHPGGFKYFATKPEIQAAYKKERKKGEKSIFSPVRAKDFKASEFSDAPSFQTKKKKIGFSVIRGVDSCKS